MRKAGAHCMVVPTGRRGRRRGFFTVDAVIGIMIVLALLMLLSAAIAKEGHFARQMAERRAAMRNAEAALLALEAGSPAAPGVVVRRLPDAAPEGFIWVRLMEPESGHLPGASLVGLIPGAARGKRP